MGQVTAWGDEHYAPCSWRTWSLIALFTRTCFWALFLTITAQVISSKPISSHEASQEINHILWHIKVHCHVYYSLLLDPIMNQMNSVCIRKHCFCKLHFNIILISTPWSHKWFLTFGISDYNFVSIFSMPRPAPLIDFIARIILGEQ
jgi:hypothetical protein